MILDTDIMSALVALHCPPRVASRVVAATGRLCTTSINWAEVSYGIALSPAGAKLRDRYEKQIIPFVSFLDFDLESAEIYGQLRVSLESQGTRLDEADLMIAAIALRHDLPLATGNVRHFQRVPGLKVEDWLG